MIIEVKTPLLVISTAIMTEELIKVSTEAERVTRAKASGLAYSFFSDD